MDTDEKLNVSWWEWVKYYAQLAIERFELGVAVPVILATVKRTARTNTKI